MPRHWAVPDNAFDEDRFMARYGLLRTEFRVIAVDNQMYVSVIDSALPKITDDPPIFNPPQPFRTREDYAIEFIQKLVPNRTVAEKKELVGLLRRIVGELPPERQTSSPP